MAEQRKKSPEQSPGITIQKVLDDIAKNIANDLNEIAHSEHELKRKEYQLRHRERELMPKDGWEGKNSAERKADKEKTLFNDQKYVVLSAEVMDIERDISVTEASLEGLYAKRRSLEYGITARLADVLEEKSYGNPARKVTEKVAQGEMTIDLGEFL